MHKPLVLKRIKILVRKFFLITVFELWWFTLGKKVPIFSLSPSPKQKVKPIRPAAKPTQFLIFGTLKCIFYYL